VSGGLVEGLIYCVTDRAVPGWSVAGDEHVSVELPQRVQRTDGAVLIMREVGRQQARSDTVERGMGGDQCVASDQHPAVRQEEAGVPGGVAGVATGTGRPGRFSGPSWGKAWAPGTVKCRSPPALIIRTAQRSTCGRYKRLATSIGPPDSVSSPSALGTSTASMYNGTP